MKEISITCSGCGEERRWIGSKCLDTCSCLAESICDTAPYPECNGANGCDTCEHQEDGAYDEPIIDHD